MIVCTVMAKRSRKPIGNWVSFLLCGLTLPVVGNLILVVSRNRILSDIGFYFYFLGLDVAIYALLHFTLTYCEIGWRSKVLRYTVYSLWIIDVIQYIVNPFFHQAYSSEAVILDGSPYYRLIPHLGQTYHRALDYGVLLVIFFIYDYKIRKTPRIHRDKYVVIFASLMISALVETYYIFSRRPVDMSMIAFAVFGFLVFYFALYYRPLRLLDRMLAGVVSDMPEAIFFFDNAKRCIWSNNPGIALTGIEGGKFEDARVKLDDIFGEIDYENTGWCKKLVIGTGDDARHYYIENTPTMDENLNITGFSILVRDNTQYQRDLMKEMYNATHDGLTGLYTREYLYECIEKKLQSDADTNYLILYIDIVNFNIVNDVFGRQFGDHVLYKVSDYLKNSKADNLLYGRLGGHTFGAMVEKSQFNQEAMEEKLINLTVKDENLEHHIVVHIGVYEVNPEDETDVTLMFDSARLATSRMKEDTPIHIVYYDDIIRDEIVYDQLISNQLQLAIDERQIRPYLQPIVNNKGELEGAEALVRWIHPDDGFLSPAAFIPVFEKNGLIADVDRYMWRCACEILADWKKRNIHKFISINISPKDFYFMDVVDEIEKLVDEFGIQPEKLRIEITETVMMTDADDRLQIIKDLRDYGFIVEMDDFGSGYSSLNLLKDMPVDVLKIDMHFLNDSNENERASKIVKNIINMSGDLGIASLTEGVETRDQYAQLADMGCLLFQGYYFSRPVPVDEFEHDWLRRRGGVGL
ncbi:MAG: EAL domain-containing protein [Clostridiales bacterium]|nr:EAL domain-containing protein [Clostridiales bacterium]